MRRKTATQYLQLSGSHFDELVRDGVLPEPRTKGNISRFDRVELDEAMGDLPRRNGTAYDADDDIPDPSL